MQLRSQQEVLVWPQGQALNCQGHPPLHLAVLHQHRLWCRARGTTVPLACGASPGATGESAGGACMASGSGAELSGTPTSASGGVEVALSGAGPGESTSSGCGASPGATGESAGGACMASGPGAELSGTPTSASGGVASAPVRCRARRQQFLGLRCLSRCNWGVSRRCLYGLRARR